MPKSSALACICALLAAISCSRKDPPAEATVVHQEQPYAGMASVVRTNDHKLTGQLLKGFHQVEQGSWRWTEKQFSVALKIPATGRPSALRLQFALSPAVLARLGPVSLAATVNGVALPPETYPQAGQQVYRREIPAAALTGAIARADFQLDKALPPGNTDKRELAVIVTSVGLEAM